jgi:diguanylate cyclase (GGDEF)-like protein
MVVVTREANFDRAMDLVTEGVYSVVRSPISIVRLRQIVSKVMENKEIFEALVNSGATIDGLSDLFIFRNLAGHFEIEPLLNSLCETAVKLTKAVRAEAWTDTVLAPRLFVSSGPKETKNEFDLVLSLTDMGKHIGALRLIFNDINISETLDHGSINELVWAGSLFLGQVIKFEAAMKMASRDYLTNLPNRRVFMESLNREFHLAKRHQSPLSLITLDLDHFKEVNDAYGHQTGDDVLKWLANAISSVTRNGDLAARVGGEEFAILLPQTSIDQAQTLAQRLKEALSLNPPPNFPNSAHPTISQGIAGVEHFLVNSPQDLVYWSDQAMYLAKREGRDTVRNVADLPVNNKSQDVQYVFQ